MTFVIRSDVLRSINRDICVILFYTIDGHFWKPEYNLKPWPNGIVTNLGLLVSPFGQALLALALTCDELCSLWSKSNLHANPLTNDIQGMSAWNGFQRFFALFCFVLFFFFEETCESNPRQRMLSVVHLLIISHWKTGYFWLEMGVITTCGETFESVWPPGASVYASSTCGYLWVRLAKALVYKVLSFLGSRINKQILKNNLKHKGNLVDSLRTICLWFICSYDN